MTLIRMKMKLHAELIFIRKVSHLDSLWNRGTRELGNGLFLYHWRLCALSVAITYPFTLLVPFQPYPTSEPFSFTVDRVSYHKQVNDAHKWSPLPPPQIIYCNILKGIKVLVDAPRKLKPQSSQQHEDTILNFQVTQYNDTDMLLSSSD